MRIAVVGSGNVGLVASSVRYHSGALRAIYGRHAGRL